MSKRKPLVAENRNYLVTTVADAKKITRAWLQEIDLLNATTLGLPEVDDRYHIWRVPLCSPTKHKIGEVVINAFSSEIDAAKTTSSTILEARLLQKNDQRPARNVLLEHEYTECSLRNTIGLGDCVTLLEDMPEKSVDLVFTSPPYFNARPEYSEYEQYEEYLFMIKKAINRIHRVLKDGRFFVINTSPVLLRRAHRSQSSKRIAVPFDIHRLFIEEGYDFIDDIIWLKPEGAGWATGRGRRFAADRNPLQYKAVPVTEYVIVYRKRTETLIDWHIRNHPKRDLVLASKIKDDYERTNVWRISPSHSSGHPAAFPIDLAKRVISYYSFKDDIVLDPFAGSGTVGAAAAALNRRFVLFDSNPKYIELMQKSVIAWLNKAADDVIWLNCKAAPASEYLFQV